LLPVILEAAAVAGPRPDDEAMQRDAERLGIEPLFDGGALERI
jgi:hypothetical protein